MTDIEQILNKNPRTNTIFLIVKNRATILTGLKHEGSFFLASRYTVLSALKINTALRRFNVQKRIAKLFADNSLKNCLHKKQTNLN